jgi:hypothetical protein
MSLRSFLLVGLLAMGCGASPKSDEPSTAKEKLRREAKASGEDDGRAKPWGGWRYQGDRNDCFFTTGRKCFKTENAACQAVRCRAPKKCTSAGAAPATVSCK